MERPMVDIIIPVYRPDNTLRLLLQKLQEQTFVVHKVIIANTEEQLWREYIQKEYGETADFEAECKNLPFSLEVFHIAKREFDHGGTRALAVGKSRADYFICMTQDAIPADKYLVEELIKPLSNHKVAAVCGRQLAREDCNPIEQYTRIFNYPETSLLKSKEDIPKLGIKTFFCSDVCAAYRRDIWDSLGGFEAHTIFNEDMIYAGHAVHAGYYIAYAASAMVVHSHNYTGKQQYKRNFDLAVSQQQHPEVFQGIKSESEGIKMVINTAKHLLTIKKPWLIVNLFWQSACKYMGYRAGRNYENLTHNKILKLTSNKDYWYSLWEREKQTEQED